jgi:hypothetical protein
VRGSVGSSGVAEGVAWPEADGAAHGEEQDEEGERDRPDEGDQEVPGWEGDRHPHATTSQTSQTSRRVSA